LPQFAQAFVNKRDGSDILFIGFLKVITSIKTKPSEMRNFSNKRFSEQPE